MPGCDRARSVHWSAVARSRAPLHCRRRYPNRRVTRTMTAGHGGRLLARCVRRVDNGRVERSSLRGSVPSRAALRHRRGRGLVRHLQKYGCRVYGKQG